MGEMDDKELEIRKDRKFFRAELTAGLIFQREFLSDA